MTADCTVIKIEYLFDGFLDFRKYFTFVAIYFIA